MHEHDTVDTSKMLLLVRVSPRDCWAKAKPRLLWLLAGTAATTRTAWRSPTARRRRAGRAVAPPETRAGQTPPINTRSLRRSARASPPPRSRPPTTRVEVARTSRWAASFTGRWRFTKHFIDVRVHVYYTFGWVFNCITTCNVMLVLEYLRFFHLTACFNEWRGTEKVRLSERHIIRHVFQQERGRRKHQCGDILLQRARVLYSFSWGHATHG